MGTLQVDTTLLRVAGEQLRVVATEFQHANANSDDAADAVGHRDLADAVRSFAHNWDDRRAKMVERIGTIALAASLVSLLGNIALAATGDGEWSDVAWSAIGVLRRAGADVRHLLAGSG